MYGPFPESLYHVLMPVLQWLHVVAAMLIVGGTLFYEFVVPHAIDDLREEQQLAVLGKVRWVFRQVVLVGALLLLVSGAAFAWRLFRVVAAPAGFDPARPIWWWSAHSLLGAFALVYGLKLTFTHRVPPMSRMRVNFVLLLVTVFLASVGRHIRLSSWERHVWEQNRSDYPGPGADASPPANRGELKARK